MAKRKKRATARRTKLKAAKRRRKAKPMNRATGKKSRKTAKKVVAKTSRSRLSQSKREKPQRQQLRTAVETTVIDVVDEPIPGVVRVTEIEETRVTSPDQDNPVSSRDIPEPDSLGG